MKEASEAAFRAAAVMSEKGHCKHQLVDEEGRVCFVGALLTAINGNPYMGMNLAGSLIFCAVDREAQAILLRRGEPDGTISYNNNTRTTGEDIISLLKEAGANLAELQL